MTCTICGQTGHDASTCPNICSTCGGSTLDMHTHCPGCTAKNENHKCPYCDSYICQAHDPNSCPNNPANQQPTNGTGSSTTTEATTTPPTEEQVPAA